MNTFTAIKQFCLANLSPKQFLGMNHPDQGKFGEKKVFKAVMAVFNFLLCLFIICLSVKRYFYYQQEPLCRESPGQIEPYIFIYNSTLFLLIGLIIVVVLLVQNDILYPLHCLTFISDKNLILKYTLKIWFLVIIMFLMSNFLGYILSGKHILLYEKQQYSQCNYLVSRGKSSFNFGNQTFIKSQAFEQIKDSVLCSINNKQKRINFFEGISGVGKSTGLQHVINEIMETKQYTKEKQIFIYYNNFQGIDIQSQGLYQFQMNSYNINLVNKLFEWAFGVQEQKKVFKIQQQLSYLSQRAKVVVIFDGVNKVKSNEKFLKYLKSFSKLFVNPSIDFHLFLCSSQKGLRNQYNKQFQYLRFKYTTLNVVHNQKQKQLGKLLEEKISSSTISEREKKKIRQGKQQIINLCYGFGQLNNLFIEIQKFIKILSVGQIIKQLKQTTYEDADDTIDKNMEDYKQEICAILNGNEKIKSTDNIKELQQKNILFSKKSFYSKIIQVSFRQNYPYCQQEIKLTQNKINNQKKKKKKNNKNKNKNNNKKDNNSDTNE